MRVSPARRPGANAELQGLGDDSRRLPLRRQPGHRRHRRRGKARAHGRGDHRAHAPNARRDGRADVHARRRSRCSAPRCAYGPQRARGSARSHDARGREPSANGRAGDVRREFAPPAHHGRPAPRAGRRPPSVSPLIKPFAFLLAKEGGAGGLLRARWSTVTRWRLQSSVDRSPDVGPDMPSLRPGARRTAAEQVDAPDRTGLGAQRRQGQSVEYRPRRAPARMAAAHLVARHARGGGARISRTWCAARSNASTCRASRG